MVTFKQFLAFPMYLSVIWLLWVLIQQTGTMGLLIVGSGLVMITFSIWVYQKLNLNSLLKKILTIVILLIFSFFPLKILPEHDDDLVSNTTISKEMFSQNKLQELLDQGHPVFVNVTASWCLTCQMNKVSLSSKAIQKLFQKHGIIYLEADWTNYNSDITSYLESFGQKGVPFYAYYPKGKMTPIILPQILTPSDFEEIMGKD
jgi:thiol:disulfide interchange protein DsbD